MCIPFGETSSLAPRSRSSVKVSAEYLGHIFQKKKIPNWGYSALQTQLVFISSPEHEVLMVSYCNRAVSIVRRALSVVNFLPCVRSRGHIFSPILMKLGQNVCLNKISDEFEIGSCGVKN